MDADEYSFIKSDWSTYNEEPELDRCIYCGEEDEELNIVYYAINDDLNIIPLSINPKPHEHVQAPKGYKKRYELVCNRCMEENERYKSI